jgi:hypothetical protein
VLDDDASKTAGTPEWWLLRLGKKLSDEQARFNRLESYWAGTPPLPHGNRRMREAYKRLQRIARTNFGALIAEAVLERLKVVGFRAGSKATADADDKAWQWWQRNNLDADSGLVHRAAVILSRSYVCVGEDPDEPGKALVTAEDPRQVIHESSPTNRRKVIAALKTYWDDVERAQIAILYLPDEIHYYRSTSTVRRDVEAVRLWNVNSWDVEDIIDNPLGEVPVTPFVNRPDMAGNGLGEFEDVIDILDRINTVILDRLVISAMQAYRQRWAKGVSLTDENGNPTDQFDPGADLLWSVEDEAAQFGEFSPTDLTPIIKSIESDVQYLSAITRTPPHYVLSGIVNASGDALRVAETGLTSKAGERQIEFGESWERVYRQVSKQFGNAEVSFDAEVLWKDPQFRSLTERASASVQLKSADVPWKTRMRMLDFTPQDIERMETERMQDAFAQALATPLPNQTGLGPPTPSIPGQPPGTPPPITPQSSSGAVTAAGNVGNKGTLSVTAGESRSGPTGSTTLGADASWEDLYKRARSLGIKTASKMSKAELLAAVGA